MRQLTTSFCLILLVFLGGTGESFALPSCPGSYYWNTWNNCFGTFTYVDGDKYVGEWRDDKRHGQGTYTYADGRVEEGIWENDNFLKH